MKNYTFFKSIYYRYTHFSKENVIESFDNTPNWNSLNYCKISKVGDLIKNITLKIDIKVNDYSYKNIDEKEELYTDEYLSNFIFLNENKLIQYINKVITLLDLDEFNTKLNDLNLQNMIEILKNFKLNDPSNLDNTSQTSNSNVQTSSSSTSSSDFILDMNYINNSYTNEFNKSDVNIIYKNLNEIYAFKKWDYFKLYHFMQYYECINDLNFLYENNLDIKNKKTKIKILQNLEIFKLLDLKKKIKWNPYFAHNLFSSISLEIGNETLIEYDNLFYDLYTMYHKEYNTKIYEKMILNEKEDIITIYLPILLKFYIPCISLKYNEIVVNVKTNSLENLCSTNCSDIVIDTIKLYIDYIYLSEKERNLFCTETLYFLIHTTERIEKVINNNDFTIIDLEFNKICKQLYWFIYDNEKKEFLGSGNNHFELILENEIYGNKALDSKYYTYVEPWKASTFFNERAKKIMSLNFSIYPNNYQPSGFIDFKNFKSKKLLFNESNFFENKSIIIISYATHLCRIEKGYFNLII